MTSHKDEVETLESKLKARQWVMFGSELINMTSVFRCKRSDTDPEMVAIQSVGGAWAHVRASFMDVVAAIANRPEQGEGDGCAAVKAASQYGFEPQPREALTNQQAPLPTAAFNPS